MKNFVLLLFLFQLSFLFSLEFGNRYISVYVDEKSGRFIFNTAEGLLSDNRDNNINLFFEDYPPTSFATIVLDSKPFIVGGKNGKWRLPLTLSEDNTVKGIWTVFGLEITEILSITNDIETGKDDLLRISYIVDNYTGKSFKVEFRMLFDTAIGKDDTLPFFVEKEKPINTETEFVNENLPDSWELLSADSSFGVKGIIKADSIKDLPYKIIFANWKDLYSELWEYKITKGKSFKSSWTMPEDGACAIYWKPSYVDPLWKKSRTFTTFIGLANPKAQPIKKITHKKIEPKVYKDFLRLSLNGPSTNLPTLFSLNGEVQNITETNIKNIKTKLILPSDLNLVNTIETDRFDLIKKTKKVYNWSIEPKRNATGKYTITFRAEAVLRGDKKIYTVKKNIFIKKHPDKKPQKKQFNLEPIDESDFSEINKLIATSQITTKDIDDSISKLFIKIRKEEPLDRDSYMASQKKLEEYNKKIQENYDKLKKIKKAVREIKNY